MKKTIFSVYFFTATLLLQAQAQVNYMEYYFDTDPGFGNGFVVPVIPGIDIDSISFNPDVSSLLSGYHRLQVRSRNTGGIWSHTAATIFCKLPASVTFAAIEPIKKMEYFIDTDPGIGNAVPLVCQAGDSVPGMRFPFNMSGKSAGLHRLYIRSQSADDKWSTTAIDTFSINAPTTGQAIIINSLIVNPPGSIVSRLLTINSRISLCAGKEVRMAFDPSGLYNVGNVFTVQLSGPDGLFTNPVSIGTIPGVTGTATTCRLPEHITPSASYRLRVVSSSPAVTGDPGLDSIIINDVNVGADTTIYHNCPGETTNLNPLFTTTGLSASWNTSNTIAAPPGTYRLLVTNSFNCTDTAFAIIKLETAIWTGTLSSNWHTPGNWNINKIPTDKTHVIITGSTPYPCIISTANAQAASIQVMNGGTMQTINGKMADVKGKCVTLPPN